MKRTVILVAMLGSSCGPADPGDTHPGDTTNGDSDGTATSGGGASVDPCDTTLTMGVSGVAIYAECDVGLPEECESPAAGQDIAAFTEDPRIEVVEFFPSELDPSILPVAETVADEDGRFELELAAGTWVLCAVDGNSGYCSTGLVIDDTQPLRSATYYSGNGDSWSVGTCPGP
jgi:hypothetical protein